MAEFVQQLAQTETVTQQDELVLELRALFPSSRQVLDRGHPLLMCRFRLPGEGMQMTDERCEHLQCPRIRT